MRFDLHLRQDVASQLEGLAGQMAEWEAQPGISEEERDRIHSLITPFSHTTRRHNLVIAGVDGSGDFPTLSYADSFVYLSTAQATTYASDSVSGLREVAPTPPPLIDFVWLPEDDALRSANLDAAFSRLTGASLETVVAGSDYLELKSGIVGQKQSVPEAIKGLIRPHAADSSNLSIQLRSSAELSAAYRHLETLPHGAFLFVDGTFSLPFVGRSDLSLYFEHLKRLCCVDARRRGVYFLALSKSHGLPGTEILESLSRQKLGLKDHETAEHWYLRIPAMSHDGWHMSLVGKRHIPPVGSVSYLVRFHKNVPILRIDLDRTFWAANILGTNENETSSNESRLFENLDYSCHDQRCYGYPYPIKAAHDRASLTHSERSALHKLAVDAAVKAGMRRSLFRDVSKDTGHR